MANTKKYVIAGIGIAIVIVIGASFTSYLGQIEEVQKQDGLKSDEIAVGKGSPGLGSPTAPVTIIEMGDYQCEMCKRWYDNTRPMIIENFVDTGKANLIFLDLPILGHDSKIAAEATYCADDQGKYWQYHNIVFKNWAGENTGWVNMDSIVEFATHVDLDISEFNTCITEHKYHQKVIDNENYATIIGINATPTFLIFDDKQFIKIIGAQELETFQNALNQLG